MRLPLVASSSRIPPPGLRVLSCGVPRSAAWLSDGECLGLVACSRESSSGSKEPAGEETGDVSKSPWLLLFSSFFSALVSAYIACSGQQWQLI